MSNSSFQANGKSGHYIFRRYITKNDRRIYPKKGKKAFKIWVED